ncbi:tigger transposable element-derived protein 4-like [Rhizophagus irregularis DAOM 181602=DAOM 197198]|nr:tigger transposable element-derived protein 4-like [Rhizophagus irregularis DAOM 181602=DAOM 197198]
MMLVKEYILTTKALDFALLCNEEKFKASNGWLDNFKKRHNLKQYNIHGEGGSTPIQDFDSMREKLRQTLRDYEFMIQKIFLIVMRRVSSGK